MTLFAADLLPDHEVGVQLPAGDDGPEAMLVLDPGSDPAAVLAGIRSTWPGARLMQRPLTRGRWVPALPAGPGCAHADADRCKDCGRCPCGVCPGCRVCACTCGCPAAAAAIGPGVLVLGTDGSTWWCVGPASAPRWFAPSAVGPAAAPARWVAEDDLRARAGRLYVVRPAGGGVRC